MTRPQLKTESEVLDSLTLLTRQLGMPPTIREIQQYLGVGSTRTVLRYLKKLETEGRIKRWKGARGVKISASEGELISREAAIERAAVSIAEYVQAPASFIGTIEQIIRRELTALPAAPAECLMADCVEPQAHFCVTHVLEVHAHAAPPAQPPEGEIIEAAIRKAAETIYVTCWPKDEEDAEVITSAITDILSRAIPAAPTETAASFACVGLEGCRVLEGALSEMFVHDKDCPAFNRPCLRTKNESKHSI